MAKKQRMQFDFTDDAVAHLDALVARSGASSRAEVVRRALSLFSDVMDEQAKGGRVYVQMLNGDKERIRIY